MPRPNNGPRLEQTERGTFEIRWTENGRSRRISTRTFDRKEAEVVFAGWLLEQQQPKKDAPLTLGEALRLYDENHVAENVVNKQRERDCMKPLLRFFGNEFPVANISQDRIVDYCRQRRAGKLGGNRTTPIGDGTIRRELTTLNSAMNFCCRKLKRLKIDDLPSITMPPRPPARDYWLTQAQLDRLMAAAQPDATRTLTRIFRFVALARWTAARKKSIERLRWEQVDLDRALIDYRTPGERGTTKRKVPVPIAPPLLAILRRAHQERKTEWVLDHPGSIRTAFEHLVDKCGMPDCTPHTLRHTWATLAAQRRVPMWEIAGILGDSVETVSRNYLHHCPEYLRGAVSGAESADGAQLWHATADTDAAHH